MCLCVCVCVCVCLCVYRGVELILQAHPEAVNTQKIDDGSSSLHVAARFNTPDIISCLASIVCIQPLG